MVFRIPWLPQWKTELYGYSTIMIHSTGLAMIYKNFTLPISFSNCYGSSAVWSNVGTVNRRPFNAFYNWVSGDRMRVATPAMENSQVNGDGEGYIQIIAIGI